MLRFVAKLVPCYSVTVESDTAGLWTLIVAGGGRARLQFSNVYGSTDWALRDAEMFARYALELWGIPFSGSFEWHAASLNRDSADASLARRKDTLAM